MNTSNIAFNLEEFCIPTYVVNLKKRTDRREHIKQQFINKPEFNVNFVDACENEVGRVGLWESIVKVVNMAENNNDDVIIFCEDDHLFTQHYSKEYLFVNIIEAYQQGADILSGGVGAFGIAVPVAKNRYWLDFFNSTQFIVLYKKIFSKILNYKFKDLNGADFVLSSLALTKQTIFPFISIQKEFGYSDITKTNNQKGIVENYFNLSSSKLEKIHLVSSFFNYKF